MSSDATTGATDTAPSATTPVDFSEASRRLLDECFNQGKLELADQLISPEAINHDPGEPARMRGRRGPEVFKETVTMYRGAFPDNRITVDDVIAAGDRVVLRWHGEGTHRGELEGLAPTGARGSVTGITISRWENGKIVESWSEWDNLGLARQLGAAPPEGSIGEKIGMALQRLTAWRMRQKHQT